MSLLLSFVPEIGREREGVEKRGSEREREGGRGWGAGRGRVGREGANLKPNSNSTANLKPNHLWY